VPDFWQISMGGFRRLSVCLGCCGDFLRDAAAIRARRRGIDVRIIADRTTPIERKSGLAPLAEAGVPMWIDRSVRIAHSKSMVIDGKVTLTGSMNWTGGAARNSENLNLVGSPTVAVAYAGHWHQRLALSSPYSGREDWCHSREPVGVKSESWPR